MSVFCDILTLWGFLDGLVQVLDLALDHLHGLANRGLAAAAEELANL